MQSVAVAVGAGLERPAQIVAADFGTLFGEIGGQRVAGIFSAEALSAGMNPVAGVVLAQSG